MDCVDDGECSGGDCLGGDGDRVVNNGNSDDDGGE